MPATIGASSGGAVMPGNRYSRFFNVERQWIFLHLFKLRPQPEPGTFRNHGTDGYP